MDKNIQTNTRFLEFLSIEIEKVNKTWEPFWTKFLDPILFELAKENISKLDGVYSIDNGGWPNAERKRIKIIKKELLDLQISKENHFCGLNIIGNFLFDKVKIQEFRGFLENFGIEASDIGDIWLKGDRGAQGIITPESGIYLNQREGRIRDIKISLECIAINEIQAPYTRAPKRIVTVEASKRIDAIASAGFGVSRAKLVKSIKNAQVKLNWITVNQPNKEIKTGDCIYLEGKGNIKILDIALTKRERWKIQLLRN
tara:strand:- start:82 stop:852 length:771 start_codon:yes stop_codon:yes gene_type:complete